MALAGRSARRGGAGARWLAVGLVITLLILLVDASLHSRSSGPGQQLAAGAWIDRALPIVTASNEEGQELAGLWANGLKLQPATIESSLQQLTTGAASNYSALLKLRPPTLLTGPAGLLETSLYARRQAVAALRGAFQSSSLPATSSTTTAASTSTTTTAPAGATGTTGSESESGAVQAIQTAGSYLQVGDQAYQLFSSSMPKSVGVTMPASVWVTNSAPYQPQQAQIFLASLQSAASTTPVHHVKIYSVATTPGPVSTSGGVEVLPDATSMTVTIVVADVGNQPEPNLTVTAAISPPGAGSRSVRDFVSLLPGQAHTIVGLGPLNPPQGPQVTMTITVTPAAGSTTPVVTQTIVFSMPAPPPPSTTTSTTVAGSTSTTRTTPTTSTASTTKPGG